MRYAVYLACLMLFLAALVTASWLGGGWWIGAVVFGLLSALGTSDLLQKRTGAMPRAASCSRWAASSR